MGFPQLIESKLDSVGFTYKADSSWIKTCLKNSSFINAFETCFSLLKKLPGWDYPSVIVSLIIIREGFYLRRYKEKILS
jgi:hypothetical protein